MRKNVPKELKTMKLNHRESAFFQSSHPIDALCVMWRDKKARKPCVVVSTEANAKTVVVKEGRAQVEKPEMIDIYNQRMNGCDKADQMVSYYGNHKRKSMKWWKKLFYWIIEITQVNAHIIYCLLHADNPKKMTLKAFKEKLVDSFAEEAAARGWPLNESTRPGRRPREADEVERVSGLHLVDFAGKDRDCVHCSTSKKRKRSSYICTGCVSKPHLCPKGCFRAYHEKALRL